MNPMYSHNSGLRRNNTSNCVSRPLASGRYCSKIKHKPRGQDTSDFDCNPEEINIFSKAFLTEIASDTKLQKKWLYGRLEVIRVVQYKP